MLASNHKNAFRRLQHVASNAWLHAGSPFTLVLGPEHHVIVCLHFETVSYVYSNEFNPCCVWTCCNSKTKLQSQPGRGFAALTNALDRWVQQSHPRNVKRPTGLPLSLRVFVT